MCIADHISKSSNRSVVGLLEDPMIELQRLLSNVALKLV